MRVLLLGASGYLGSSIYKKLKQLNYEVYGTSYQSENENFYKLDINDIKQNKEIMNHNPDIVIWSLMSKNDERKLTDVGLSNILETIPPSTKFIYISSDSVFSEGKGNYKEDDPTQYLSDNNTLHVYSNSKIDAEKRVKEHENHLIIRTGPIYGQSVNRRWDNRVGFLIDNLIKQKKIKRTSNLYKTFVHIEDLRDSVVEIINKDMKGIIHVGPLQKESYYSFSEKSAKKLGLDYRLIEEDYLSEEEAISKGIPLDTSLNTEKCYQLIKTKFRNV